jgi:hypothetical protein
VEDEAVLLDRGQRGEQQEPGLAVTVGAEDRV